MNSKFLARRPIYHDLAHRLKSGPQIIQVLIGPRQVGKTTTLRHFLEETWDAPFVYASADSPVPHSAQWISEQWEEARKLASGGRHVILALDEVQKVPHWSDTVKAAFDEDRFRKRTITPIILGSSALLMGRGLSESLAGRFELIRFPHWFFSECKEAFGASLREYLYFGGYPGSYALRGDLDRWRAFIFDSLIESTISRDILALAPIEKPALFRQTFALACRYPAQILAYQKFLGQLVDAGNTTTIAHYLDLLGKAFLVAPLQKWSDRPVHRASSPKLVILNNALISALSGKTPEKAQSDADHWGHIVENAIGAHLLNSGLEVYYWRERDAEVDFVARLGDRLWAIEVTAGNKPNSKGLELFVRRHPGCVAVTIGGAKANFDLEHFLGLDPIRALESLADPSSQRRS